MSRQVLGLVAARAVRSAFNPTALHSLGDSPHLTLVILIPVYYNPDGDGIKRKVEIAKVKRTESEIRDQFSGYSRSSIDGWWRDESTGEEFQDHLIRFEIDAAFDGRTLGFVRRWKKTLESRFQQRAIYLKLSGPALSW